MTFKQTLIATAILLLTSTSLPYLTSSDDQPLKRRLSDFPMQVGQWNGTKTRFDERVYETLGVDDSVLVNYSDPEGESIQLYIGYYQSQRAGQIIHSPKNCMPGSGWSIVESSLISINLKKNGQQVPRKVIKLVLKKGTQRQVALYWFHSRGRIISSEYSQKIFLVWDSITKHRTDGSFVRLLSRITDHGEAQTSDNLKHFAEQILSVLDEFIPSYPRTKIKPEPK
jgi:EpsI family protein